MERQELLVLFIFGFDEVAAFFQDVLHCPVAVGLFGEGHAAGSVEALEGILLREVDDADAAAVGLVGIGRPLEDGLHQGPRVDTRLPSEEAVMGGPVLGRGRVAWGRH